ncbi:MAG: hypothetical protein ACXWUP_14520 [Allosphingosinicella sp.]
MIWFTLTDGESIAIAPEHVRYVRPTDDGDTTIFFSRDDRCTVALTPTEVVAKLSERRRAPGRAKAAA